MKVRQLLDNQDSSLVTDATNRIDGQATADRVSQTPTLFFGKTGSKLKPVSSTATFDAAQLVAAIRALG
jgi:hypothetical protein